MTAQITKTPFRCELVTIHSKRSFADLISRIEATFQYYEPKTLRDLTAEGDTEKLEAYVKQVGGPTEFAIFFSLDQGSTQRLAGIPIESRFYLFGNATIAQGLFRYSPRAGLGAPVRFCVSQRDGEDMAEFGRSTHEARSFAELKRAVEKGLSKAGLMLFMQLDHGAVLQKETGQDTPRTIRLLIGNPLIMKEMAKHVPDAGSYAPVTVLVDERADGVHMS